MGKADKWLKNLLAKQQTPVPQAQQAKFKPCHEGNVKVFTLGKLTMHGGGSSKGCKFYSNWLIIDLADNFEPIATVTGVKMPSFLAAITEKRIKIDWRDMGTPYMTQAMWLALVADLKALGKQDVLVCCMGGHGRTGTALAILSALMLGEKEPIKFVRRVYCEEAVETEKQVKYVEEITGLTLNDKSSKGALSYAGGYTTNSSSGYVGYPSGSYTTTTFDKEKGVWVAEKGGASKSKDEIAAELAKEWEEATCKYCVGPKKQGICLHSGKTEEFCDCRFDSMV